MWRVVSLAVDGVVLMRVSYKAPCPGCKGEAVWLGVHIPVGGNSRSKLSVDCPSCDGEVND